MRAVKSIVFSTAWLACFFLQCDRHDVATATSTATTGISEASASAPTSKVRPMTAEELDAGVFIDETGHYAAAFPGMPISHDSDVDIPGFGSRTIHTHAYRADRIHSYVTQYFEFGRPKSGDVSTMAAADIDKVLDAMAKASMDGWTPTSSQPTSLANTIGGRDIMAERHVQNVTVRTHARIFITKALRVYAVQAVYVGDSRAADTFIGSFLIQG
jgi:hypothetical protein